MKIRQIKQRRVMRGYRLHPQIVEALQQAARDHQETEARLVEKILAAALGVRRPPKPLNLHRVEEVAG